MTGSRFYAVGKPGAAPLGSQRRTDVPQSTPSGPEDPDDPDEESSQNRRDQRDAADLGYDRKIKGAGEHGKARYANRYGDYISRDRSTAQASLTKAATGNYLKTAGG